MDTEQNTLFSISDLLKNKEVKKSSGRTSERAEAIRPFVGRVEYKGKILPPASIASKLAHVKTSELHYLFKECEKAKNFSALFWYLITTKKPPR